MAIDPITAGLVLKGTQSFLSLYGKNKVAKQQLQELNQNILLAQLTAVSNTNDIMSGTTEILRNNETMASTSGYYANDSASFRAIQARVSENEARDLVNVNLQKDITISSMNASLKNVKDQMTLDRINLGIELGSMYYSHTNYMKDKKIEEVYRKNEEKYRTSVLKQREEQIKELKTQNQLLLNMKRTNKFNQKILMRRVTGNYNRGYEKGW